MSLFEPRLQLQLMYCYNPIPPRLLLLKFPCFDPQHRFCLPASNTQILAISNSYRAQTLQALFTRLKRILHRKWWVKRLWGIISCSYRMCALHDSHCRRLGRPVSSNHARLSELVHLISRCSEWQCIASPSSAESSWVIIHSRGILVCWFWIVLSHTSCKWSNMASLPSPHLLVRQNWACQPRRNAHADIANQRISIAAACVSSASHECYKIFK